MVVVVKTYSVPSMRPGARQVRGFALEKSGLQIRSDWPHPPCSASFHTLCCSCVSARAGPEAAAAQAEAELQAAIKASEQMTAEALAAFVRGSVNMRQPVRGDRVTVCDQPRNTDFLQAGQVGTVVDIDDMDVEDVWFTVEDADGETDEYCEADLVIAATSRTAVAKGDAVDESHLKVATLAAARGHVAAGLNSRQQPQGTDASRIEWTCGMCGKKDIAGSQKQCPVCTAVRGRRPRIVSKT